MKFYNGRKIILWGKYVVSDCIKHKLFNLHGIETEFYVDSNIELQNNDTVFSPSVLNGKSDEYYVIIPLAFYQSLKNTLTEYGYKKDIDYHYFCDCIVTQSEDYYEDLHGNKIIGNYKGLHFAFSGFNSVIELGEKSHVCGEFYLHNDSYAKIGNNGVVLGGEFYLHNNSYIKIGDRAYINDFKVVEKSDSKCVIGNDVSIVSNGVHINLHNDAEFIIGDNFKPWGNDTCINLYSGAKCVIGDDFSVCQNCVFDIFGNGLYIGNDCMFSHDIHIISTDGHSIFDVNTGENINSTPEINQNRKIVIGNHVWIGMRATILYNTEIGDGSIIGAGSLVKGKIPNNCIAAGVPARVVRRDVAWSRNNCSDNILDCGEEYINLTEE